MMQIKALIQKKKKTSNFLSKKKTRATCEHYRKDVYDSKEPEISSERRLKQKMKIAIETALGN